MTLAEFIAESQDELERFEEYWEESNIEDEKGFPLVMPPEQWTNKFTRWCTEEDAGDNYPEDED